MGTDIRQLPQLSASQLRELDQLCAQATTCDGSSPFGEQTQLSIAARTGTNFAIVSDDERLQALAHVSRQPGSSALAELAVGLMNDRVAAGTALLRQVLEQFPELDLWLHGTDNPLSAAATACGLQQSRTLLTMARGLTDERDPASFPDGITVRTFDPNTDATAWLELNAKAFAELPDQGGWTRADLQQRLDADWFDADGFFLAEAGEQLAGFHWTKIAPDTRHGEVFVIGVDQHFRGRGLAKALTLHGLKYLHDQGCTEVELYVDARNTAAINAYQSLGFRQTGMDRQFSM